MKDIIIKGQLKLNWNENLPAYGIYTGKEYIKLDELLWTNTNRACGVIIKDFNNSVLFDKEGRLVANYSNGYERYLITKGNEQFDLDNVLWNLVESKIEITFKNFNIELTEPDYIESEADITCLEEVAL